MRNDLTELVFILDRSGSMHGLEKDTIGGFNSVLERNKALPGDANITTILFDHRYTILHDRQPIRSVAPITEREYRVGGSTALLDAIGRTINKIAAAQKNTAKEYRADKVLFVIITDGEENSSREFSARKVKKMIEQQKKRYDWEFIFLGANIDAVETAGHFGIRADCAVDYVPDGEGTELNFRTMGNVLCAFREEGCLPVGCLEEIRADMRKRGGRRGKALYASE